MGSTAKGACDKVSLIGINGSPYTTQSHANAFTYDQGEAQEIARAFNSNEYSSFQEKGIVIGGVKYQFLRADDEEKYVLGKKKDHGAVTLQASKTIVIMAHTEEGKTHGDTNTSVGNMVTYLNSVDM